MIDFRYHLVSLISVFMALAVGIVLGAGPLKEAIGDALTGEVEELRTRSGDLREQLEATSTDLAQAEAAMTAVAPGLLEGVLTDRRVAVIELDDVDPAVRESVLTLLEAGGATVTTTVQVTEAWADPAQQSFRGSLAGSMLDFLSPVPPEDAGTQVELAQALVQAVTRAEPTDPDVVAEEADVLLQMLLDAELVELDAAPGVPADAVVVLAGPTVSIEAAEEIEEDLASAEPEVAQAEVEAREAMISAGLAISTAAQDRSAGVVVAGGELSDPGLVRSVRQDGDLAGRLTTVDSVNDVAGQVAVVLALGARIEGTVGHYGFGAGAGTTMPPRVQLEPPVRVPDQLVPDDGTEGTGEASADGEAQDGAPTDGAPTDGAPPEGEGTATEDQG